MSVCLSYESTLRLLETNKVYLSLPDWFVSILGLVSKLGLVTFLFLALGKFWKMLTNVSNVRCRVWGETPIKYRDWYNYLGIIRSEGGWLTNKINWKSLNHLFVLMVHYIHHFSVQSHQHLEIGIKATCLGKRYKNLLSPDSWRFLHSEQSSHSISRVDKIIFRGNCESSEVLQQICRLSTA